MHDGIYFDNSATTPMEPRAAEAMRPFLAGAFGNPSSLHSAGREAKAAVDRARGQIAELLNAKPEEIVFTGSGTESDNLALLGVAESFGWGDCHIITSAIEHPAILETCRYLQRHGVEATFLPVGRDGVASPDALAQVMKPATRLVSVMAANNVAGTLQPILELARVAHAHGALFHTDAVQMAGRIPLDAERHSFDLLSLSAHKFHGPKGVGALYIRQGAPIMPLIHGGGQEFGLRSATENVAGIVGAGCAAQIAREEMAEEAARLVRLRDHIIDTISETIPNAYLIGHRYQRLPGHICLGFSGLEGEAIKLLLALDAEGFCISSGSACSASHAGQPSHVLTAMGYDPIRARGSLRITLGRFNTEAEVRRFLAILPQAVGSLRSTAFAHVRTVGVPG